MFDTVIMVDWSGGNDTGARPKKDAIWAGLARQGRSEPPLYLRNRAVAEVWVTARLAEELAAGRKVCIGFDFAFGYPDGFARAVTGQPDPLALWDWFEARVQDSPQANNRFDLAAQINAQFPGIGPFWANGLRRDIAHLPRKGNDRTYRWRTPKRQTELLAKGSFECWQLAGAGAVGSQIIMGLPVLARLRRRFGEHLAVWPFEQQSAQITLLEIWPSLLANPIKDQTFAGEIRDAAQVRVLAGAISMLSEDHAAQMLDRPANSEGWIFGVGHETQLRDAAARFALFQDQVP